MMKKRKTAILTDDGDRRQQKRRVFASVSRRQKGVLRLRNSSGRGGGSRTVFCILSKVDHQF